MKILNRYHGVKLDDPNIVYIGRPSSFGNPFPMGGVNERFEVIEMYRDWFNDRVIYDSVFRKKVLALRGKDLACWCAPKPCHGEVIISWLKTNKE